MQFSQNFKNHKNFRFTKITDKTNEKISLKSPKTLFFGPLVSFARWGFFQKNPALSHTSIYWPLTPCYVSGKKIKKWANSEKTYGQTDTPYFIGSFRPMPGVQQLQLLHHWMEHSDRNFDHTVIKKAITDFFLSIQKVCQKWKWHINFFRSYWWLKCPEIWLTESILGRNLRLRFLPNLGISQ